MIWVKGAHDVVIRHLRIRPGVRCNPVPSKTDALKINTGAYNVIVDHSSMSWAWDKIVSIWGVKDVTLQWSILAEGLWVPKKAGFTACEKTGDHEESRGLLVGGGGLDRVSIHHNLMINNRDRNPLTNGGVPGGGVREVVNNVIHNPGFVGITVRGLYGVNHTNVVANYYKDGPNTNTKTYKPLRLHGNDAHTLASGAYLSGNVWDRASGLLTKQVDLTRHVHNTNNSLPIVSSRYSASALNSETDAVTAKDDVLAYAGARKPVVSPVDARLLLEFKNGAGQIVNHENDVGGFRRLPWFPVPLTGT